MKFSEKLIQNPVPGSRMVKFRGDTVTVALNTPVEWQGNAWLRTNIGQAGVARREIIREVLHDESPLEPGLVRYSHAESSSRPI